MGELIQTDTKIQASEIFDISANDGAGPALSVRQNGSTQDIAHFYKGSSSAMVIDNNGDVGIGTTAPSSDLQVNGNLSIYDNHRGFFIDSRTGDPFFDYFSTFLGQGVKRTGNKAFEAISDGVNTGLSAIMMERTNIRFYTNIYSGQTSNLTLTHNDLKAKERMVINNAGNIGIGTTSPSAKLHISNESTSRNEFTALRLSNRGNSHKSARSVFDFVVQDIVTESDNPSDLGQRKMSIRFKAGYDGILNNDGTTSSGMSCRFDDA